MVGEGQNTLIGGLGNDTYVTGVTGGTDTITEALNAGTDTVETAVTLTLGANLENLTLSGTLAINGTGNALANTITGNAGADVFVFSGTLGAGNIDRILSYDRLTDQIEIENAVFARMIDTNLALAASTFTSNLTGLATLATQRIIYETDTGFLWFDQDGTGGVAARHFATVTIGTALAASEFTVI